MIMGLFPHMTRRFWAPLTLLLGLGLTATGQARADGVSGPYVGEDNLTACEPGQEEGDDCLTYQEEEGTCVSDTMTCINPPTDICFVCETDCSVSGVGGAPRGSGLVGLLVLAAALRRRQSMG